MASIRPSNGPIPKPRKREKSTPKPMSRGGRKPKEAGRAYESRFAKKYDYHRQVGSGAFASEDPTLAGDVVADIGTLKLLIETKSWDKIDGRGEKTVTFPVALLDKISAEARLLMREPIFLYHVKGASNEWAVIEYEWLHDLVTHWESTILALVLENEELRNK